jgi:two-component system, NtrC family, sensor histidine kinase HydH
MGLFLLLAIFSAALVYITHQNAEIARTLASKSLESTALALSATAENALRRYGGDKEHEIRQILSDRVVAYALIADQDGTILFHTNPGRIGTKLTQEEMGGWLPGPVSSRQIILGTGIPAYEFDFTLRRSDGRNELLRLILNSTQADMALSWSNRLWWVVGSILVLLWAVGFFFERAVTSYARLQARQEEQERLTLIGQMTAVLAHEIRNAIAGVKGYAQWAREKTDESQPATLALDAVLQGTGRIETLVNELLLFSKDEEYQMETVDLAAITREAIRNGLSSWKGNVEVHVHDGTFVRADREKLYRTLVNGIRNASEAVGQDETIRISTAVDGRWVELRIADTGPGLSESNAARIFTPFFTTKADGTGLGLAYAQKVVNGMGGIIELQNRKDARGAVLGIRLPAA